MFCQGLAGFGECWLVLACVGRFWQLCAVGVVKFCRVWAYFGRFWQVLACVGRFCKVLISSGKFWHVLSGFGCFWQLFAPKTENEPKLPPNDIHTKTNDIDTKTNDMCKLLFSEKFTILQQYAQSAQ